MISTVLRPRGLPKSLILIHLALKLLNQEIGETIDLFEITHLCTALVYHCLHLLHLVLIGADLLGHLPHLAILVSNTLMSSAKLADELSVLALETATNLVQVLHVLLLLLEPLLKSFQSCLKAV